MSKNNRIYEWLSETVDSEAPPSPVISGSESGSDSHVSELSDSFLNVSSSSGGSEKTETVDSDGNESVATITEKVNVIQPLYKGIGNSEPQIEDEGIPVKIICLGDSAVGKSKLVERFLLSGFEEKALSTHAVTTFTHNTEIDGEKIRVSIWDTAGQEKFNHLHSTYYHDAHACIIVFDCTRRITYRNIIRWHRELKEFRPEIPVLCAANKIDADPSVTNKVFQIPKKLELPFYFVSAANGTNVVKLFRDAIRHAVDYKKNPSDFVDTLMEELQALDIADSSPNEPCDKPKGSAARKGDASKPCDNSLKSSKRSDRSDIDTCDKSVRKGSRDSSFSESSSETKKPSDSSSCDTSITDAPIMAMRSSSESSSGTPFNRSCESVKSARRRSRETSFSDPSNESKRSSTEGSYELPSERSSLESSHSEPCDKPKNLQAKGIGDFIKE